jgi:hypothetical protein
VQTAPLASCGPAPSGQEGLHPVGNPALCNGVTTVDCGPLLYTAVGQSQITHTAFSPRIGGTFSFSPNAVLRFSAGRYTQPTETAFEQYLDQSGKRAASFNFTQFWGLGFNTPVHDNPVQYSDNYDLSLEYRLHGTDWTMKASPFYRDTHNQVVTVPLGPNFASGVNVGLQHSWGLELQIAKGDPTRDGLSGALSYTWTRAILQYGNLPSGTNSIDYLNNYIKAFNCLTKAGFNAANGCTGSAVIPAAAPCYQNGASDPSCTDIDGTGAGTVVANPYYNLPAQPLLDRRGFYPPYVNEPPNDPLDQGSTFTAIAPNVINMWIQYKHGKLAIAPNLTLLSGSYYGSPTDTYGVDPRACAQNQGAAVQGGANAGTPVNVGAGFAQNPDYLSCAGSPFVPSGYLAIPNPYTGHMDNFDEFQEPWQANLGMLIRYDISPKITANVSLTNIFNRCFGGHGSAWQSQFAPNNYTCTYLQNNFNYVGPTQGQPGFGGGFFYGAGPSDPANGGAPVAPAYNYPYAPYSGALPFQAYFELQIKL